MPIELFRNNFKKLEYLAKYMRIWTSEIDKDVTIPVNYSLEECKEITEALDKFLDDFFKDVNFVLHNVSFRTNWKYRMGEFKKKTMSKIPRETLSETVSILMDKLSPEERAALAKKLGGQ